MIHKFYVLEVSQSVPLCDSSVIMVFHQILGSRAAAEAGQERHSHHFIAAVYQRPAGRLV